MNRQVVAVFAFAGIAWAVTDAMTYTVTVKPGKGKPSAKTPVPMVYSVDFEAMSKLAQVLLEVVDAVEGLY